MQPVRDEHMADKNDPADLTVLRQIREQHAICQEPSGQLHHEITTPLQSVLRKLYRLHDAHNDERAALLDSARSEACRMRETLCELHNRYA
jgi:hypothetical protein